MKIELNKKNKSVAIRFYFSAEHEFFIFQHDVETS